MVSWGNGYELGWVWHSALNVNIISVVSEILGENVFQTPKDDLAPITLQFKPGDCHQRCPSCFAYMNEIEEQESISKGAKNQTLHNFI